MSKNKNVVATLGLQLDRWGRMSPELEQRVDKAVRLFKNGAADALIMSGSHSFSAPIKPPLTEAEAMAQRALKAGVPRTAVKREPLALDTIGSALLIKEMIKDEGDNYKVSVVTSGSHLPRALYIFRHVFGPGHHISGVASDGAARLPMTSYEEGALLTARTVLDATRAGDHAAIWERLAAHIPDYNFINPPLVEAA